MSRPNGDYKQGIQEIFEGLCDERYHTEYFNLDEAVQMAIYREAEILYFDRLADWGEYHREGARA